VAAINRHNKTLNGDSEAEAQVCDVIPRKEFGRMF